MLFSTIRNLFFRPDSIFLKISIERSFADVKLLTNIGNRSVFLIIQDKSHLKGFRINGLGPSSFAPSGGKYSANPFTDHFSAKL